MCRGPQHESGHLFWTLLSLQSGMFLSPAPCEIPASRAAPPCHSWPQGALRLCHSCCAPAEAVPLVLCRLRAERCTCCG